MLHHLLRASVGLPDVRYFLVFFEQRDMVDEAIKLGYPVRVLVAGRLRDPSAILKTIAQVCDWIRSNDIQLAMSWMSKAHLCVGVACWLARVPASVLIDSPNAAELKTTVERLIEAPEFKSSMAPHAKDRAFEFDIHRLARRTTLEIAEVSQR
ncbi:protein of unknown function [Burkholderia multivorans]